MDFSIKSGSPEQIRSGCIVIGVFEKNKLSDAAQQVNTASGGQLLTLLKRGDLQGKPGFCQILYRLSGVKAERVLVVGCGSERNLNTARFDKICRAVATELQACGSIDAVSYLAELEVQDSDIKKKVQDHIVSIQAALYQYDEMKSAPDINKRPLKKVAFVFQVRKDIFAAKKGIINGQSIAAGQKLTRDLGNMPANICTPTYLANTAKKLVRAKKEAQVKILEEKDMQKLGMGSLLSVSQGSRQPAKLITLEYKGGDSKKPVVLVGKGVTFDSGGISIKPSSAMDEMKYDMCGAATVLGVFKTLIEMQLPINVTGIIPATENLPDGEATKPGDIVTSMSGKTIEVLNTDAEGRLILCDALTYAEKFNPDVVIDMATLTGAVIVALGRVPTGVMGNNAKLIDDLIDAGKTANDRLWELPLWDDYQDLLKSNFADMANIGGREGGTITAACFLSRFTENYKWAHLDIAGTAWVSGANKGATGRPVGMLMQYLMNRC